MNHQADFPDTEPAQRLLVTKISADHASRAHKGQFRKDDKNPYITPPIRVPGLVGILNAPPEATLMELCDRIGTLIDSADRNNGFTDHYLSSTNAFDAGSALRV